MNARLVGVSQVACQIDANADKQFGGRDGRALTTATGKVKLMSLRASLHRSIPMVAAVGLALTLGACTSGLNPVQSKARGYAMADDQIVQVRAGQSAALVTAVLGSPQTTNNFGSDTAWYYIGERVEQTAFGLELKKERTLLAVYFDKNMKVTSVERLGVEDGRVINMETRRTPSYGLDRNIVDSILASF